jgi:hypothetical protein
MSMGNEDFLEALARVRREAMEGVETVREQPTRVPDFVDALMALRPGQPSLGPLGRREPPSGRSPFWQEPPLPGREAPMDDVSQEERLAAALPTEARASVASPRDRDGADGGRRGGTT